MSKDVIFLVADKDTEQTIHGLLERRPSLQIRQISYDVIIHPQRDPGCWNESEQILRIYSKQYSYSIVIFDHHGSGQDNIPIDTLQADLEDRLNNTGWNNNTRVIILEPELEIWVWSDSNKVDICLGWENRQPDLRSWLRNQELLKQDEFKPKDPKAALEKALREVKKPRSSAIYNELAKKVSFNRCTDSGFIRLKETLRFWFPT